MPKPGKKPWKVFTYDGPEHDMRGGGDNQRRVNFKTGGRGGKFDRNQKNFSGDSIRAHFLDEDIDMAATSSRGSHNVRQVGRYQKKPGGRPSIMYEQKGPMGSTKTTRPEYQPRGPKKLMEGPLNWYRITVRFQSNKRNLCSIKFFIVL